MVTLILIIIFLLAALMFSIRGVKKSKIKLYHSLQTEDFNLSVRNMALSMRSVERVGVGIDYSTIITPIRLATQNINEKMQRGEQIFEFEKWLYENYYLTSEVITRGLAAKIAELPHFDNIPRILKLARFIVDHSRGCLSIERIKNAVKIFNITTPLYFEELNFLKEGLLIALVENLSELGRKSLHYSNMSKKADCPRFLEKYASSDSYVIYYNQKNKTDRKGKAVARYFRGRKGEGKEGVNDAIAIKEDDSGLFGRSEYGYCQSLEQNRATAEYCINAIRLVKEEVNNSVIYDLSYIYERLKKQTLLEQMDDDSKYLIMTKIKKITAKTNVSEKYFCDILVELLAVNDIEFTTLLFDYEREVIRCVRHGKGEKIQPKRHELAEKLIITFNAFSAFIGGYMTAFGIYLAVASARTGIRLKFELESSPLLQLIELVKAPFNKGVVFPLDFVALAAIGILFSIILYPKLSHLFNLFFHKIVKKGYHFSMNYKDIAAENPILITKAVFCADKSDFIDSLKKLMEIKAMNNYANAYFCLLIDTPKSDTELSKKDIELIEEFENMKVSGLFPNVNIYLRKKTLKEGKYIPYERKRGAINALNDFLLGAAGSMTYVFDKSMPRPSFICLLDDDNIILPGAVLTLSNNMLHPYNQKFDLMAMKSKYNLYSESSLYSKRFERSSGIERYPQYADTQFAITKKANYCGKGVYRLSRYAEKLEGIFQDNTILSHDIIEGANLYTGLAEVIAYEDSPKTLSSELERQKRWNRGDALLLGFLGKKHKNQAGKRIKNDISVVYKDIIIKNNINMIEPLIVFILIAVCAATGNAALIFSLVYTMFLMPLLDFIGVVRVSGKHLARYSVKRIYYIFKDKICELALMPYYCVLNISIYFVTLYKYCFNREKLLEWKTFKSSQKSGGYKKFTINFLPSYLFLIVFCALVFNPYVVALALVSIIIVNHMYCLGTRKIEINNINEGNKELLNRISLATGKCILDLAENKNSLPSDNLQSHPKQDYYDKTSPTNIGFYILNLIAMEELEQLARPQTLEKLTAVINTVEKLKKWNGCLYNWYNIHTLKTENATISSVDEGNFLAALITLHGYLTKDDVSKTKINCDDKLQNDSPEKNEKLAERVKRLIDCSDIEKMYDENRKLFHIGVNTENGKFDGHYDLMASEAMILSYIAVLLGKISAEHWFNLSRAAAKVNGNTLLSWSGTMFEYMLPHLFFDVKKSTLLYQTAKNVAKEQRKNDFGGVYGISECANSKLDNGLRYQYYAYGINELSLRNEHTEPIISPYSSFLALEFDKHYYENLSALERFAYNKSFGFYDSAVMKGGERKVICTHFAHHQGMIMTAAANILKDNAIKKYFNAYAGQSVARLLLTEERDNSLVKKPVRLVNLNLDSEDRYAKDKTVGKGVSLNNFLLGENISGMLGENGQNYFVYKGKFLNRYRFAENGWYGGVFYLQNPRTGEVFCPTKAPISDNCKYSLRITSGESEYTNETRGISLKIKVTPHQNTIVKVLTVKNEGENSEKYNLYYYEEIAMNDYEDDISHQCFQNIFVRTDFIKEENMAYAVRKDIHSSAKLYYGMKVIGATITPECNRFNFLGRNRAESNPLILEKKEKSAPSIGDTLEPCLAFSSEIIVEPHSEKQIIVAMTISEKKEDIIKCAQMAEDIAFVKTLEQLEKFNAHYTDISQISEGVNKILNNLFWLINNPEKIVCGSATLPFVMDFSRTLIKDVNDIFAAFSVMQRLKMPISLTIIFSEYDLANRPIERQIKELMEEYRISCQLRDKAEFEKNEKYNKKCTESSISLSYISTRKLEFICAVSDRGTVPLPIETGLGEISDEELKALCETRDNFDAGEYASGEGSFLDESHYAVKPFDEATMLPYSNVCADKNGGFITTENGGGFTFFGNSQLGKMTVWYNDVVKDRKSEDIVLVIGGKCLPLVDINGGKTRVVHTLYKTTFITKTEKIFAIVEYSLLERGGAKKVDIMLKNLSNQSLDAALCFGYFMCLGKNKAMSYEKKRECVLPRDKINDNADEAIIPHGKINDIEDECDCVYIKNPETGGEGYIAPLYTNILSENKKYNRQSRAKVTFVLNKKAFYTTTHERRCETYEDCTDNFVGVNMKVELNADEGGMYGIVLTPNRDIVDNIIKYGSKCADNASCDIKTHLESDMDNTNSNMNDISENTTSANSKINETHENILRSSKDSISAFHDSNSQCIENKRSLPPLGCGNITIKSNIPSLDIMFNYWLLYQVKSSRIFGKLGYYQAGGATGYRDQLQDCLAMLYSDPTFVREHIMKCCAHQYIEGDVQHWWHEEKFGVRTRITDDRLFLAYVTAKYILATGDQKILEQNVEFLISEPLKKTEKARVEIPKYSNKKYSVYEHIAWAIDCSIRYGEHGLLLIGSGDWNDALDDIGDEMRGESVWLTAFGYLTIKEILPFARTEEIKKWSKELILLREGINNEGYNGQYFNRAITREGEILGDPASKYCKIDLITQSTVVMGDSSERTRLESAMTAAESLVDIENGLVKLLSPPFDDEKYYGYISSYPKGVRENGGQYTHGVAWYIIALCTLGYKSRALEIFNMINPAHKCTDVQMTKKYKGEPYVFSADIYTNEGNEGRCGWTFYTGSAAWLYRAIFENILGIKLENNCLVFDFKLPNALDGCEVLYKTELAEYRIKLIISEKQGLFINGAEYIGDNKINLNEGKIIKEILLKCKAE